MPSLNLQSHLGANEGIYGRKCGMGKLSASAVKAATRPGRYSLVAVLRSLGGICGERLRALGRAAGYGSH